jgi:hypothetical protein
MLTWRPKIQEGNMTPSEALEAGIQRATAAIKEIVPRGTSGIYDKDPKVSSETARRMVKSRKKVWGSCKGPGCVDPETGKPVRFFGYPNKETCSAVCCTKLWRQRKYEQGYTQTVREGVYGWLTPDGVFVPSPTQPKRKGHVYGITNIIGRQDSEASSRKTKKRKPT